MGGEEYLTRLREAILKCDVEEARRASEEALRAGVDAVDAVEKALAPGLREVGERFHRYELYLPHLLLASDAMSEAMKVLEPAIPKEKAGRLQKGRIVIGTVEGDLHDIGKNVVVMLLKSAGFQVYDIGKDVKTREFVKKAKEYDADIIGASCLMTTTMPYQRELIEELERLGLRGRFKVMVGGGPITKEWAEKIGADGYGRDASEAVNEARRLLGITGS